MDHPLMRDEVLCVSSAPLQICMSLHRVRNSAAALLLSLATLTGCHSHTTTSGLTTVKFQADWYPQPEHGGFYDAIARGYYKAEGLDVQIIPGGPYLSSEALVASGAVQFGMNSSDHVLESIANANEPIVAVGAAMQHDPQGIMFHANSPIRTFADLNGHTLAVKPGSTWWEFIRNKFRLDQVHEIPATFSVANFLQDPTTSSRPSSPPNPTSPNAPASPPACSSTATLAATPIASSTPRSPSPTTIRTSSRSSHGLPFAAGAMT